MLYDYSDFQLVYQIPQKKYLTMSRHAILLFQKIHNSVDYTIYKQNLIGNQYIILKSSTVR